VVFDETQFPFLSAETAARLTIQSELVPDSDGAVIIQGCHHPTPPSPNTPSTPPLNAVGSATLSPNPSSSSPATHNSPDSTQAATSASSPATAPAAPAGHPMQTRSRAGIYKPNPKYALTSEHSSISPIPKSVRTALQDPNWRAAMAAEFDALQRNRTWRLVD
jgi:histone deacetylase 1/2